MGGEYSMHGREKKYILKEEHHLDDFNIDGTY
jgi:hypothetical protein